MYGIAGEILTMRLRKQAFKSFMRQVSVALLSRRSHSNGNEVIRNTIR